MKSYCQRNVDIIISQTILRLLLIKRDFLLERMRFRDQPYSRKIYLRRFTHDVIHKYETTTRVRYSGKCTVMLFFEYNSFIL